jgi:hypothetical protein
MDHAVSSQVGRKSADRVSFVRKRKGKRKSNREMTNLEAIRFLRATSPEWAQFSEANLLRRYYEAKALRRESLDRSRLTS